MTEDNFEDRKALIAESERIDSYDFEDPADPDAYYSVELYKAPDGRYFRNIVAAGMNAPTSGWTGIELLDGAERWKEL